MNFRSEINGLRAIAVLAVLLFHARVPFFRGGFAGVDVFFVISGFLMTKIILDAPDRDGFTLFGFWMARARRIVPALMGLCAGLGVLGWFAIDPLTYLEVGQQVATSLAFVSNIAFWRESGYFDQAAETKWLLHTWSLSVEWQFYLVYPLVLLAARRLMGRRATAPLLWLGFVLSLALSIVVTPWRPTMAFFLLPTRAWEMIAGGLVFLHGGEVRRLSAAHRRHLEIAGLGLIVGSLALITSTVPWPSFWALLPVVGTAAVIFADRRSQSVLNVGAVQALGSSSYSVYLWHWPVIVGFGYYGWNDDSLSKPIMVGIGLALGGLSYNLVENPLRRWLSRASLRDTAWIAAPAFGALFFWAAATIHERGFINRSPDPALIADAMAARTDWAFPDTSCARVGRDRSVHLCRVGTGEDTLVIGDSHANQWFVRAADGRTDTTFVTRDGCPPLPDVDVGPGVDCRDFYRLALRTAAEGRYKRIVIAAFWQSYVGSPAAEAGLCVVYQGACVAPDGRPEVVRALFKAFADDLAKLPAAAKIVLVLPDLEPPGDLPAMLAKRIFFGRGLSDLESEPLARVRGKTEQMRLALETVAREVEAETVDPLAAECDADTCRFLDANRRSLFRDSNHLRASVVRGRFDFLDPYLRGAPDITDATRAYATGEVSDLGLRPGAP